MEDEYRTAAPLASSRAWRHREVFLARAQLLGRNVALKLLRSHLTQVEERVRRFRHEAPPLH